MDNEAYKKWKLYTEYLDKIDEAHKFYMEHIADQFMATADPETKLRTENLKKTINTDNMWQDLKNNLNDMCADITNKEYDDMMADKWEHTVIVA